MVTPNTVASGYRNGTSAKRMPAGSGQGTTQFQALQHCRNGYETHLVTMLTVGGANSVLLSSPGRKVVSLAAIDNIMA